MDNHPESRNAWEYSRRRRNRWDGFIVVNEWRFRVEVEKSSYWIRGWITESFRSVWRTERSVSKVMEQLCGREKAGGVRNRDTRRTSIYRNAWSAKLNPFIRLSPVTIALFRRVARGYTYKTTGLSVSLDSRYTFKYSSSKNPGTYYSPGSLRHYWAGSESMSHCQG